MSTWYQVQGIHKGAGRRRGGASYDASAHFSSLPCFSLPIEDVTQIRGHSKQALISPPPRYRDLSIDITRRLQKACARFQRYKTEIYDRPGVRLRLKVRLVLLKAEVIETLVV